MLPFYVEPIQRGSCTQELIWYVLANTFPATDLLILTGEGGRKSSVFRRRTRRTGHRHTNKN